MVDVDKRQDLEQWLETLPQNARISFAARAALRCLPAAYVTLNTSYEKFDAESFLLACFRSTLISGAAGTWPASQMNGEIRAAARSAKLFPTDQASEPAVLAAHAAADSAADTVTRSNPRTAALSAADSAAHSAHAVDIPVDRSSNAVDALVLSRLPDDSKAVFEARLWANGLPKSFSSLVKSFEEIASNSHWAFWAEWYRGMLTGNPVNWALQRQIALIENSVWADGPASVAVEIERIREEMTTPPRLDRQVLVKHIQRLLQNPVVSKSAALNGAVGIEIAIETYKRDAPANCLPEGMEHLEQLPAHFRAIAAIFEQSTDASTKENDLVIEIQKLHARVTELERDLAVAKSKTLKGTISKNAAESFGKTIGNPVFYGGIAVTACHFFGVAPLDITFENFRAFVSELISQNPEIPPHPNPELPHIEDV